MLRKESSTICTILVFSLRENNTVTSSLSVQQRKIAMAYANYTNYEDVDRPVGRSVIGCEQRTPCWPSRGGPRSRSFNQRPMHYALLYAAWYRASIRLIALWSKKVVRV